MQSTSMEQAKLQATTFDFGQPIYAQQMPLQPQGYNNYAPVYSNQFPNGIPIGAQPMQLIMVQIDPLSQEEMNIQRDMSCSRTTFFIFLVILASFDALGIIG